MIILLPILFICFYIKWSNNRVVPGHNHLSIFFGIPGSGKTTFASYFAQKYLKKGFTVYSNVPICGCRKFDPVEDLGVVQLDNCLIIIDEAALCFNARDFAKFPKSAIEFFKLHRHYKAEVILFSQSYIDVDATIRRVCFQWYIVRKGILPNTIQAVPIRRRIGINEQSQEPADIYSFYPLLLRPLYNRTIYAPKYWKYFDSWEAPELRKKKFKTYAAYRPRRILIEKLSAIRALCKSPRLCFTLLASGKGGIKLKRAYFSLKILLDRAYRTRS